MNSIWLLHLNPFLWEGIVFAVFGFIVALSLHAIYGFPRRLLENL